MATKQVESRASNSGLPRFNLKIPDLEYYRSKVDCSYACPVQTDARGYVTAIARGDYEEAWWIARQPNPFSSICGWICAAPCESACRRGRIDDPLGIKDLKRFVNDIYGVAKNPLAFGGKIRTPENSKTAGSISAILEYTERYGGRRKQGARIAIVGAGPAGLTAAHDLSLLGHRITIFEGSSAPGGMIYMGVPRHRIDRDLIAEECQAILDMPGIDIHYNTRVGVDVPLRKLRDEFDAVVLATGLFQTSVPPAPGSGLDGVVGSLGFVRDYVIGGRHPIGDHVVVVGGDNMAMDACRSAVRAQIELGKEIDVRVYCDETWDEMPADSDEKQHALAEGVVMNAGWGLAELYGNGKVQGARFRPRVRLAGDLEEMNLRRNTERGTWEVDVPCETVVFTSRQTADLTYLGGNADITSGPLVQIDLETGRTTAKGVYAAGDVAHGASSIVHAVQAGHLAARSIEGDLQEGAVVIRRSGRMTVIPPDQYLVDGYLDIPRQSSHSLPPEDRLPGRAVPLGYSEAQARAEANRCLKCNVNTVFKSDLCILCNLCVDVCPYDCLQLVKLDKVKGDGLDATVKERYGLGLDFFRAGSPEGLEIGTAMMKDDDVCTRCGLCAKRCPVDVITMEWFSFAESLELVEVGAV